MQHLLKPPPRTARAKVIAPQFLLKLNFSMHKAPSALHMCFRGERFPPLASGFESRGGFRDHVALACSPPVEWAAQSRHAKPI